MPAPSMIRAVDISASGLDAETRRMEIIANNVANAQTTKGEDGNVYRRKEVVFSARLAEAISAGKIEHKFQGVQVSQVAEDSRPLKRDFRPGHPEADADGYVTMPNVNTVEEMVDMMSASRSYEANLSAVKTARSMANQAIDILR